MTCACRVLLFLAPHPPCDIRLFFHTCRVETLAYVCDTTWFVYVVCCHCRRSTLPMISLLQMCRDVTHSSICVWYDTTTLCCEHEIQYAKNCSFVLHSKRDKAALHSDQSRIVLGSFDYCVGLFCVLYRTHTSAYAQYSIASATQLILQGSFAYFTGLFCVFIGLFCVGPARVSFCTYCIGSMYICREYICI